MRSLLLVTAAGAALLWGCSDDGGTKTDATAPDAALAEAGVPDMASSEASVDSGAADGAGAVSFSGEIQPIFTARCASGSCHGGASPKQGLSLETTKAHAALVGVASTECATLKRVEASDASKSYLIQKLEGAGSCFSGAQMPFGAAPLDSARLALIRAWIDQGAKDN